jgi:SAM-dependent methyltransferase
MPPSADKAAAEAAHYRRLERRWQDELGWQLLDGPHQQPGSAAVMRWQFDRIIAKLDLHRPGVVVEIGCGRGHLLERVRQVSGASGATLVGVDVSRAITDLPGKGLVGVAADGEVLPFRDGSVAAVVYDGALHHLIDYPQALREAHRVLAPGGTLVLFEPLTSAFTRLVLRLRARLMPRGVESESPIDLHYRDRFREDVIVDCLRAQGMRVVRERTDFLSYPATGCYAGFAAGRSAWMIRGLMAFETVVARTPVLRRLGEVFAWRFTIAATKP